MDLVPSTATQKWSTRLWFNCWRNRTYTNTLTTNTKFFLFMHQDPNIGGPRTSADTLSLLPLTNQPATDPKRKAWSFFRSSTGQEIPSLRSPKLHTSVHNSSSQNSTTNHTNPVCTLSCVYKAYVHVVPPPTHWI